MEFLLIFVEGIASFISPCMLPMVPIYISYFAGKEEKKKNETLINSIGFVLGFTIVFTALAVITSAISISVSPYIRYVKMLFGILIIILGLNYIGIVRIGILNKTKSHDTGVSKMNFLKVLLFGMIFSISWTPCVGAFLSSALLLIAKEQNLLKGILLILTYSIGLGLPFILSAIFIDKAQKSFNFLKKHFEIIKIISGIILVIMGITMFI